MLKFQQSFFFKFHFLYYNFLWNLDTALQKKIFISLELMSKINKNNSFSPLHNSMPTDQNIY